jgi:hypothetical protein
LFNAEKYPEELNPQWIIFLHKAEQFGLIPTKRDISQDEKILYLFSIRETYRLDGLVKDSGYFWKTFTISKLNISGICMSTKPKFYMKQKILIYF